MQDSATTSRDYRKLRSNPRFFIKELLKVNWEKLATMKDIDDMENYWSQKINECFDIVVPWKTRKFKRKMYHLPKEIQIQIKLQKELMKLHKANVIIGKVDDALQTKYKEQRNYCNRLIKRFVREKTGSNVTSKSSVKEIWKNVNDILRPGNFTKNSIKIKVQDQMIEDPQLLAKESNRFFKQRVEILRF